MSRKKRQNNKSNSNKRLKSPQHTISDFADLANYQGDFLDEETLKLHEQEELKKKEERIAILAKEDRFFNFVKKRTNNFEYLLQENYDLIESGTGKRGGFGKISSDPEDIEFQLRFHDIIVTINDKRKVETEDEILKILSEKLSKKEKTPEMQTLERIINSRLDRVKETDKGKEKLEYLH